ncbi:homoserine kinase [Deinococcus yavapaiensis]|uniref:Homoserine kinase n=1 Tax=Deinococcus yavapaiensis KR-236 TaxID=694435 RepID=A0A318SAA2_9DEIO|nr:homoserine kinase [Deinococcus yavapaiensis]PYE54100.1 homoserine kinase [Deinococcus yavapaiensis KR-236]
MTATSSLVPHPSTHTIEVRAPASSANLGSGFDAVGLALSLHTTVRATLTERPEVITNLPGVPLDETNYVYRSARLLADTAGKPLPPLRLEIESDIPLARGLGSSAAALIAGLVAANTLLGEPLTTHELLDVAAREEGHPDNVGACLLGGAIIATLDDGHVEHVHVTPPAHLGVLLVIPHFELLTSKARGVLPHTYTRADTVHALSHAALLAAALTTGRLDLLHRAMQDRLHQPHRAPLVPGLTTILNEATTHGALGAALSGAGPSVLCFYDRHDDPTPLTAFLHDVLHREHLHGTLRDLTIDPNGTTHTTPPHP